MLLRILCVCWEKFTLTINSHSTAGEVVIVVGFSFIRREENEE